MNFFLHSVSCLSTLLLILSFYVSYNTFSLFLFLILSKSILSFFPSTMFFFFTIFASSSSLTLSFSLYSIFPYSFSYFSSFPSSLVSKYNLNVYKYSQLHFTLSFPPFYQTSLFLFLCCISLQHSPIHNKGARILNLRLNYNLNGVSFQLNNRIYYVKY